MKSDWKKISNEVTLALSQYSRIVQRVSGGNPGPGSTTNSTKEKS